MPRAHANGIELEYEVTGAGEPLVLIMGIGAQLVHWPQGLIDAFVDRGFRVIRFDNRDAGKSTWLRDAPVPDVRKSVVRGFLGLPMPPVPYTLLDMADDVAGLLDSLDIADAHVVGASLGGMVAQCLAIAHPGRVRSLTSIMSTTGNRWATISRPRAIKALLTKPPKNEEEAAEHMVRFRRICGSRAFPLDEQMHADIARRAFRRGLNPRGFARQLAAVMATGDRTWALRRLRTPTLVVHGSVDPLIPPTGGRATARAIRGARLELIRGMGHDLPKEVWPIIADGVADLAHNSDPRFQLTGQRAASASRTSVPA